MTLKSTPLCSLSRSGKGRQVGSLLYLLPVHAPPRLLLNLCYPGKLNHISVLPNELYIIVLKQGRSQSGEVASLGKVSQNSQE